MRSLSKSGSAAHGQNMWIYTYKCIRTSNILSAHVLDFNDIHPRYLGSLFSSVNDFKAYKCLQSLHVSKFIFETGDFVWAYKVVLTDEYCVLKTTRRVIAFVLPIAHRCFRHSYDVQEYQVNVSVWSEVNALSRSYLNK